jgi:hypothetical protein
MEPLTKNEKLCKMLMDYLRDDQGLHNLDIQQWFTELVVIAFEESYLGEELTPLFHGELTWGEKREFVKFLLTEMYT